VASRCPRDLALRGPESRPNPFDVRVDNGALYPHGDFVCIDVVTGIPSGSEITRAPAVIRRFRKAIDHYYPRRTPTRS